MNNVFKTLTTILVLMCSFIANAAWTVRYQHTDTLGSVIAESNSQGTITQRFDYKPFGEGTPTQKAGVGYTGHLEDTDLGLTYMQQRYYDPVIGRFYSNDPVDMLGHMQRGNPTMGFNRYAYANNNPYKYTDPDGRFANFIIGAIVGAGIEATVQYAMTGEIKMGEVIAAGAAGALTGGVGPMLANMAAKGTISAATAIAGTAAIGSASSVAGKVATNAAEGKATTMKDVAVAAVGGAVGAGVGAKLSNSVASTLEKGFGGLNSAITNTTRSSMVGNTQAAATTSAYTEAGKLAADVATNVAQKEIEKSK